ncbi:cutinase family protein [Nocardia sp. NPDC050630]|uniref:cutinase family protein n=1 Tax=Nocardia sp. NPDC050630 TaxID=3364321 RepID=UPI0037BB37D0
MSKHRVRRVCAPTRVGLGAAACTAVVMAVTGTASADESAVPILSGSCPGLYVLGVQGTSESSPNADPFANSGMLGQIFEPMMAQGVDLEHATIPYDAAFGGAPGTGSGTETFANSVSAAQARLDASAAAVIAQCPGTRLAIVGFSQGGGVAADFARRTGAGEGPVSADQVAAVAVMSDWTRPNGAEPIPGRPGQVTPDAPPDTDGVATSQVRLPAVPGTGGIAADNTGFGDLTGRVGEFCAAGDLSCDAPGHAAALRTVAGIAAQADFLDPIAAVQSLGAAWSSTVAKASNQVILEDIQVADGQVNYLPGESVSQRLADSADPRISDPSAQQTEAATDKISRIATAIVADPIGQIPRLVGQIGAAVAANLADNADLANPAVLAHYGNVIANHTGYGSDGTAQQTAEWFAAVSHDLHG